MRNLVMTAITAVLFLLFITHLSGSQHVQYYGSHNSRLYRSWSDWTSWSVCSRTCGGGVRTRTRICRMRFVGYRNNQSRTCLGDTTEYEICQRHSCPVYLEDFLIYQCSRYNGHTVSSKKIEEWLPYMNVNTPCQLQCLSQDRSLAYKFGKVIDGTRCVQNQGEGPSGICVNGRCTNIDCTGQLGYDNLMDKCGICRGDNSSCIHYRNSYWTRPRTEIKNSGRSDHYDYNRIVEIPNGATHLSVREYSENNFLAVMEKNGRFLVNGDWKIQSPGRIESDEGLDIFYSRNAEGEEGLSMIGPILKNLLILVLGRDDLPTVDYEYWFSKAKSQSGTKMRHHKSFYTFDQHLSRNASVPRKPKAEFPQEYVYHYENSNPKIRGYKSYYQRNKIFDHESDHKSHGIRKHGDVARSRPDKESSIKVQNSLTTKTNKNFEHSTALPLNTGRSDFNEKHRYDIAEQHVQRKRKKKNPRTKDGGEWSGRPNGTSALSDGRLKRTFVLNQQEDSGKRHAKHGEIITLPLVSSEPEVALHSKEKNKFKKKRKRKREKDKGTCSPCSRIKNARRRFCSSDFVLRATVLESETHQQEQRYEIEVIQSYKNIVPILTKEYIWTPDLCRCPRLRVGNEYIIMGHLLSNARSRESRLIVDSDSFVRRYSEQRVRTMQKLVRDQNIVCKK